MEELTNGINQARHQCHNQCSRQLNMNASSIRRTHSSISPRMMQRKIQSREISSSPQETKKSEATSPTLSLPEYGGMSPDIFQERQRSTSQSYRSLYSNYTNMGRPISTSNTSKLKGLSLTLPDISLSQESEAIGKDCFSNYTIPELPESPTPSIPDVETKTIRAYSYSSNTAPRPYSSRRTCSTSSPHIKKLTSNPDVSKATPPKKQINEDEADIGLTNGSRSLANLSQISTGDGSIKKHGSTLILRRSSLTGQVEHIRRPRFGIKTNSFHGAADSVKKPVSNFTSTGKEFRVLNTGFRSNRRSRILPNSIETTV